MGENWLECERINVVSRTVRYIYMCVCVCVCVSACVRACMRACVHLQIVHSNYGVSSLNIKLHKVKMPVGNKLTGKVFFSGVDVARLGLILTLVLHQYYQQCPVEGVVCTAIFLCQLYICIVFIKSL